MLTSIRNAQQEIFKILANNGQGWTINSKMYRVIYARKSALTTKEMDREVYPNISVFDYLPSFVTDYRRNFKEVIDGFHSIDQVTGLPTKAYIFSEPLRMQLNYDFTVFTNSPDDRFLVDDFFLGKWGEAGSFILNPVAFPPSDLIVGDPVGYQIIRTENPRKDGIFELNYEFDIKAMIAAIMPNEVDLVTDFNLDLNS